LAIRKNAGFHPVLEKDHDYIFVDSCMQIWPDAEFEISHQIGVTALAVTAMFPHQNLADSLESLMFWHLIARQYPNVIIVYQADHIQNAKQDKKVALILAAQDGDFISDKLHRIEAFYRLGLRTLILAYNTSNRLCDGCLDRTDSGLTRFGQLVVDECNRVGMVLDCTHVGHRATLEIIDRSAHPVIFSHSNAMAVVHNPRNISDEQIKACAARGGIIGLAPWGPLVLKQGQTTWPTVDDFVDHVDHVAQLTGTVNNIGIGTDMSLGSYPPHSHDPWGEPDYPIIDADYREHVCADVAAPERSLDGFNSYADVLNMIETLARRGYSDSDIRKILGENYLQLYRQVWK
jgi:membrane dipeptidase